MLSKFVLIFWFNWRWHEKHRKKCKMAKSSFCSIFRLFYSFYKMSEEFLQTPQSNNFWVAYLRSLGKKNDIWWQEKLSCKHQKKSSVKSKSEKVWSFQSKSFLQIRFYPWFMLKSPWKSVGKSLKNWTIIIERVPKCPRRLPPVIIYVFESLFILFGQISAAAPSQPCRTVGRSGRGGSINSFWSRRFCFCSSQNLEGRYCRPLPLFPTALGLMINAWWYRLLSPSWQLLDGDVIRLWSFQLFIKQN